MFECHFGDEEERGDKDKRKAPNETRLGNRNITKKARACDSAVDKIKTQVLSPLKDVLSDKSKNQCY